MRRMRRHFEVACVILDNLKGESIEKRRKKETVGWSFFRMRISVTSSRVT